MTRLGRFIDWLLGFERCKRCGDYLNPNVIGHACAARPDPVRPR